MIILFFFLTKSSDLKKNDGYLIFFYPDLNLESPRSRQGSEIWDQSEHPSSSIFQRGS